MKTTFIVGFLANSFAREFFFLILSFKCGSFQRKLTFEKKKKKLWKKMNAKKRIIFELRAALLLSLFYGFNLNFKRSFHVKMNCSLSVHIQLRLMVETETFFLFTLFESILFFDGFLILTCYFSTVFPYKSNFDGFE